MNVLCTICGGAGHLSKDCKQKRPGQSVPNAPVHDKAKIDEEVSSLLGIERCEFYEFQITLVDFRRSIGFSDFMSEQQILAQVYVFLTILKNSLKIEVSKFFIKISRQ